MAKLKLFIINITFVFIFPAITLAESVESKSAGAPFSPDLVVNSVNFSPAPEEGRSIQSVKISVTNQGKADAGKCVLSLSCMAKKCNEGAKCSEISRLISADIPVPPLKQGEATEVEWRPASLIQWASGKYSVSADIDKYSVVRESNEANNIVQSAVYIRSFSAR